MIRALVIIAVAAFLVSAACITAAMAIGGPEAIARSRTWSWDWRWEGGDHGWRSMREAHPGQDGVTSDDDGRGPRRPT